MTNIKGILTIIGLLAIGFTAGFFTHRQVTVQQIKKVREIGQAPGFERHLLRFLAPPPEQRQQLEPIIQRYARQMGDQRREHRQELKTLVESMHREIKPLLTPEQVKKLDEFSRRVRGRRDRNAPPRRPLERRPDRREMDN